MLEKVGLKGADRYFENLQGGINDETNAVGIGAGAGGGIVGPAQGSPGMGNPEQVESDIRTMIESQPDLDREILKEWIREFRVEPEWERVSGH
jgi:hypothetical protein